MKIAPVILLQVCEATLGDVQRWDLVLWVEVQIECGQLRQI
jgi:hypothetical protein